MVAKKVICNQVSVTVMTAIYVVLEWPSYSESALRGEENGSAGTAHSVVEMETMKSRPNRWGLDLYMIVECWCGSRWYFAC